MDTDMDLRTFSDVHPNWYVIKTLKPDELRALLDLALTLMAVGGNFEPEERSKLVHLLLDGRDDRLTPERLQVMVWRSEDQLAEYTPRQWGKRIRRAARTFDDDVKALAVLRLLAIIAMSHCPNVEELNFCQAVGQGLGIDPMTTEHLVRAAWESRLAASDEDAPRRIKPRPPRSRHAATARPVRAAAE